jgi:hypothetical protein
MGKGLLKIASCLEEIAIKIKNHVIDDEVIQLVKYRRQK